MYRRDLRDTSYDGLLADMAMADVAVQAAPSPTDGRIASLLNREDQTDLWLRGEDGSDTRLTSEGAMGMRYGRGDQQWLSWAPSGDRIAFLSASGTLSTVDTETGHVEALTHHESPDVGLAWGEAGVAFVTNHFSRAALALVDPDSGSIDVVADDEYLYSDPRWGADGDLYAVRAHHRDLFDFESGLVRVDPESGAVDELFFEAGVRVQNPRPHPAGDGVLFTHDESGFDAVYHADADAVDAALDAEEPVDAEQVYAVAETEIADPAWHPGGDSLVVTATRDGRVNVHEVSLDGDADAEELTEGDQKHSVPFFVGDDVHAVRDDPHTPPQVYDVSADEPVTSPGVAGFDSRLTTPTDFHFRSGGRDIHTVVYPPVGGFPDDPDSVPLLVHPHGGPTSYDSFGWDWRAHYFAALGYAVALPNYRGSDGFGRDHRNANDDDWGGGDLDDVVNCADATADEFAAIDDDRVGIYGGSGGGLMTVNALGTSDRFDAGAAFYGVYDYETFVDDTDDIGWQLMKRELGDLSTDLDNYRAASPIRTVPDIEDPLLVLHGEDDARVPISQSEQLCEELEKHGKRYEFQRYEGEPHGFSKRENVLDAYTRCADLFAKYLGIDPDDGTSRPHRPE